MSAHDGRPSSADEHRRAVSPETAVPDDETPAATCPYCARPFRQARLCDLHVGEMHEQRSEEEDAAYRDAVEAEDEDLFRYHLKVAGALGVVFTALFLLAVVGFSL
ncbi:hypothetical protein E6P09_11665 [Haloferax mediterranei ATCC 33500]|uniref:C2H2-type domain-containing protein n=1 Tax=Haloferax mediterranei (strain ATCC 33500 / DSM 1411 / JCM 8866 / NBRC 14739 / NCIMB 2177 / R-4) TaxID=523841 RepID=I3R5C4_HALMT|nr:hypothetical protein [Haloferax mediterranei]AFK19434.1 hypothetical protein HFX_1728 [Haloferax mediterranei ATCC 33500]AHZ21215.1 hypothetical protein BM92_00465 [Haloferax mediterranei ATCC 33500]EMA04376.1 hypothetical protein C439_01837 [Haloferax mediterranei ATCC 33500]MDX5989539.1 hypothetical protein [Haloferax mediterranei ATCC 33500]QCQ75895.1 hypothetical protein E6P09_11665 [Haloferax mediterranei ATCC 33500]